MRYFLMFFIVFSSLIAGAQTLRLDSLYNILKTAHGKKDKIKTFNEIGTVYLKINLDSARSNAERALNLNSEFNLKSEAAKSHMTIGKVLLYMGQLKNSGQHYDSANRIFGF